MGTENTGGAATVDAGAAAQATVDAGANRGSTQNPGAVDAANKGSKTYNEAEFKDAVAKRDAYKAEAAAAAAERDQLRAEKAKQEAAARQAEEAEAVKRGEFQKLHEAEKSAREQDKKEFEAKLAAEREAGVKLAERFKTARMKEALGSAYAAAKGNAPVLFEKVAADFIANGTVKADDDGKVTGHLDAVKKIVEAHPQLFANGAKEAVDKALAEIPGGVAGAASGMNERNKRATTGGAGPRSVAEAHATVVPKPSWRTNPK